MLVKLQMHFIKFTSQNDNLLTSYKSHKQTADSEETKNDVELTAD